MSRTTKIILGILAGLALLCICVVVAAALIIPNMIKQAVITDPAQISTISDRIAQYAVPQGYKQVAMSFLGFDTIIIAPEGGQADQMYMLMQFPPSANLSQEQMQSELQKAMSQQSQRNNINFQVIETSQTPIRGQLSTLVISEGADQKSGKTFRQAIASFAGNNGTAIVMYMTPSESWNQDSLHAFLASIR